MKVVMNLEAKQLLQKLKTLPQDVQNKVVKKAIKAGAKTIQKDAKANAPVDRGLLKKSIKIKQAKGRYNKGFMLIIKSESKHHHLIELGTDDRVPKKGKKLAFEVNGRMIFVDKVKGLKPFPYLGKAYDKNKDNVVKEFKQSLKNYINSIQS